MPGLFLDEIADFSVNADKMAPSPSALFMPSVVAGGLHSPYSNKNNAQVFDQVQQQPLYSAQDLAAELAVKLGFNDASGNASASLATAFQQQQLQQTSFLAAYRNVTSGSDGLNSGGESRSSCSETDYAALNEPTAFELLHIAAAAAAHRKSQNTTECVPVPSSEHVAEIVGRQGKILGYMKINTHE
uniref:Uncharacterized protein n=1 Tax=Romanomermis culicivorax TaxID=13658 RepID=A0A915JLN2_ROMCU